MKHRNKKDEKSMLKVDETLMKNESKIDGKSKNRSKFDPKIDPESINIDKTSILEASGPPSAFLDAFWVALGAVWKCLGG